MLIKLLIESKTIIPVTKSLAIETGNPLNKTLAAIKVDNNIFPRHLLIICSCSPSLKVQDEKMGNFQGIHE